MLIRFDGAKIKKKTRIFYFLSEKDAVFNQKK